MKTIVRLAALATVVAAAVVVTKKVITNRKLQKLRDEAQDVQSV